MMRDLDNTSNLLLRWLVLARQGSRQRNDPEQFGSWQPVPSSAIESNFYFGPL
jgi:hypothetical protein